MLYGSAACAYHMEQLRAAGTTLQAPCGLSAAPTAAVGSPMPVLEQARAEGSTHIPEHGGSASSAAQPGQYEPWLHRWRAESDRQGRLRLREVLQTQQDCGPVQLKLCTHRSRAICIRVGARGAQARAACSAVRRAASWDGSTDGSWTERGLES